MQMKEEESIDLMKKLQLASSFSSQGEAFENLSPAIEGLNSIKEHFAGMKTFQKIQLKWSRLIMYNS